MQGEVTEAVKAAANNPEATFLGARLGIIVFGFAGGVVSLRYVKNLNAWQAFLAVFTGVTSAWALTPVALAWFKIPSYAENGVAFLIGLTAMNLIPGFIKLSNNFRQNPAQFAKDTGDSK